jgi:hypothetical protein
MSLKVGNKASVIKPRKLKAKKSVTNKAPEDGYINIQRVTQLISVYIGVVLIIVGCMYSLRKRQSDFVMQ